MAFGYGHPTVDAAESAVAGGIGAGAGVASAVALDIADSQGLLGATEVIDGLKNSELIDFAAGAAVGGVGLAGAFGKGPLKQHQGAAAAAAGYGIGMGVVGAILLLTDTSIASPAAPAPAGAGRWGGAGQGGAGQGRGAAVTPLSGNQRVIQDLSQ